MVANKLKNLVSLVKETVRDTRQTLEELINNGTRRQSQPVLVRVPVKRTGKSSSSFMSPIRNFSTTISIRSFSSYSIILNSSFQPYTLAKQRKLVYGRLINNILGNI